MTVLDNFFTKMQKLCSKSININNYTNQQKEKQVF